VLHPGYKLEYFKSAGWEANWIKVAEDLVRTEFDNHYALLPLGDDLSSEQADIDNQDEAEEPVHFIFYQIHDFADTFFMAGIKKYI
jgi:hypothetical protein